MRRTIRLRAASDKIGYEHITPLGAGALSALATAWTRRAAIGDAWVFPSPGDAGKPCSRYLTRDWWERGASLAEVPVVSRLGWHALRRKFATELKGIPLRDLCELGGWKEPQTVLKCYQRADEATMRDALTARRALTAANG